MEIGQATVQPTWNMLRTQKMPCVRIQHYKLSIVRPRNPGCKYGIRLANATIDHLLTTKSLKMGLYVTEELGES